MHRGARPPCQAYLHHLHLEAGQVLQGRVHTGLESRGVQEASEQGVLGQQGLLLHQRLAQLLLQVPVELQTAGGSQQPTQCLLRGLLGPVQPRHRCPQPWLGCPGLQRLCQPWGKDRPVFSQCPAP